MQPRLALLLLALATLVPTSCQGPSLRIDALVLVSSTPTTGGVTLRYRVPLLNQGATDVDGAWAKIVSPIQGVTISDPVVVYGPTPAGGTSLDEIYVFRPTGVPFDPATLQWAIVPGAADFDADGLSDGQEMDRGLGFDRADTDGDGQGDGAEALYWSDPLDPSPGQQLTHFPTSTFFAISSRRGGEPAIALADPFYGTFEQATLIGRPGPGIGGLAVDQHGFLYAARGTELDRIDPLSGAVEHTLPLLRATGAPAHVTRITFDPVTRTLYGVENDPETGAPTTELVRIDLVSGLVTASGPPLPVAPAHIAFDPLVYTEHGYRYLQLVPEGPAGETTMHVVQFGDGSSYTYLHNRGPIAGMAFDSQGNLVVSSPFDGARSYVSGGFIGGSFDRPMESLAIPPSCPAPCFGEPQLDFSTWASQIAIGDLDGDGDLDGVTAEDGLDALGVLRNDGSGQLVLETTVPFPAPVQQVAIASLDGDAVLDVVAVTWSGSFLLRGDTSGGLGTPEELPAGDGALLVGDVTGDGAADLVGPDVVLENDGSGGFFPLGPAQIGFSVWPLALAHVDGDGILDLIALDTRSSLETQAVIAFVSDGIGHFAEVSRQPLGFWAGGLTMGDLDGDGSDEVVVFGATYGGPGVPDEMRLARLRIVGGGLAAPEALPAPPNAFEISSLAVGDVTGDGLADVVVGASCTPLRVLVGDGRGGLRPSLFASAFWTCGEALTLADLDGNGLRDVLATRSSLAVLPNGATPAP